MKELNWFQRFVLWLFTPNYDCSKGKHRWGYTLSDVGVVYLDQSKVPDSAWHCLDCKIRKYKDLMSQMSEVQKASDAHYDKIKDNICRSAKPLFILKKNRGKNIIFTKAI